MDLTNDTHIERIIALEKGKVNNKLSELRKRHAHALTMTATKASGDQDDEYFVQSESKTEIKIYTIKSKTSDTCQCKLKCLPCNACVHTYSCNCLDYVIKNNLCKHIHYVLMGHEKPTRSSSVASSELIIDENIGDKSKMNFHSSQIISSQGMENLSVEKMKSKLIAEFTSVISSYEKEQLKFVEQEIRKIKSVCASIQNDQPLSVLQIDNPGDRTRLLSKQVRF